MLDESTDPLIVTAKDRDIGPNGVVSYAIVSSTAIDSMFTVDAITGSIRSKSENIDYETVCCKTFLDQFLNHYYFSR
jgi:hypothetical protein